ncbi:MAG: hypothetical protein LC721_05150 [Actinobacteria bacterium]|jgi:hypothetical protein|nr:hypothetical protein [Actinomycetota bacterium]
MNLREAFTRRSVVGARRLRSALTVFGLIIRVPAEAGSHRPRRRSVHPYLAAVT